MINNYVENFMFEFEKLENKFKVIPEEEFKSTHTRLKTFTDKLKKVKGITCEDFIIEKDWCRAVLKMRFFDEYLETFEYKNENLFNDIFNQIRNFLVSNEKILFENIKINNNTEILFIFSIDTQ